MRRIDASTAGALSICLPLRAGDGTVAARDLSTSMSRRVTTEVVVVRLARFRNRRRQIQLDRQWSTALGSVAHRVCQKLCCGGRAIVGGGSDGGGGAPSTLVATNDCGVSKLNRRSVMDDVDISDAICSSVCNADREGSTLPTPADPITGVPTSSVAVRRRLLRMSSQHGAAACRCLFNCAT